MHKKTPKIKDTSFVGGKTPRVSRLVSPSTKTPRMYPVRGGPLVWRFSHADRDGPFAWTKLTEATTYKEVSEALHSHETMTETDIRQRGSHAINIASLSKAAISRLTEINLDDIDEVFSFRITGQKRVICWSFSNIMCVLWWDPEHLVCPAPKKNT